MSRFIYFLTLFLVFTLSTLAQTPSPTPAGTIVNTPPGNLAQGATTVLTWQYTASPQQNATVATLRVINNSTGNTTPISNSLNLADQKLSWTVNVPPGTYYLALNDGTGDKYSGFFTVVAGTTAPGASGSVPAPAPAATNAPAPAPASSSQPQPQPQPSAKSPATQSTPSSVAPPAGKSSNAPSASANTAASFTGSSVSGYKLLFSLMVVAAVMVHFA